MKKSKFFTVLVTSALMVGGISFLSACNSGGEGGQTVVTDFKVTYTESADYEVTGLKESYKQGETVSFKINLKNNLKTISSVRVGSSRVNADDSGTYSFEMPGEDAVIKITLIDKAQPAFAITVEGTKEVGSKLTVSATLDGSAFSDFTIAASKGADLVTINGKEISLVAVGEVTIKASATYDVFSLSAETSFSIAPNEETLGLEIGFDDGKPIAGGEASSRGHGGTWIYWGGDGGSIQSITYNASNNEYTLRYQTGWAWYGVQLFYSLPYAENGDTYALRWDVNSDVAGRITVSGEVVDLSAGDNTIAINVEQKAGATLSVQLGVNNDDAETLSGGTFKFKPARLYDADPTHTYHTVKFTAGNEILRTIKVRDGKTVAAPTAPEVSGKVFNGFYDGETKLTSTLQITKDMNFDATYIDKSSVTIRNVTIKDGDKTLTTVEVADGGSVVVPSLDLGFAMHAVGFYTDKDLTQAYDIDSAVNADLTLYVKKAIKFDATHAQDVGLGYKFPDDWFSYSDDGSVTVSFTGWANTGWWLQCNFTTSLPKGNMGETYQVNFVYSISHDGATYQIYDNATVENTNGSLEAGNSQSISFQYAGGLSAEAKLTFELGALPAEEVSFTLHSISITKI